MNVVVWIVQGLLAAAFLFSGGRKLAGVGADQEAWVKLYPPGTRRVIGALEVAAAIGLVLPAVTGIAPVLVGVAALGLAVLMAGAAVTHARIGGDDRKIIPANLVLLALAAFVAWARLGPYPF